MKRSKLLLFSLVALVCAVLVGTMVVFAAWTVKKKADNQITIADIVVDLKKVDSEENLTELIVDGKVTRIADANNLPSYANYTDAVTQRNDGLAAGGQFRLQRSNSIPVLFQLSLESDALSNSGYLDKLYVYLYDITDYETSGASLTVWSGQKVSDLADFSGIIGNTSGCKSEIIYDIFIFCVDATITTEPVTINFPLTLSSRQSSVQVANGGFENGMTGWTVSGDAIGDVSSATHYWLNDAESAEGFAYNKDGEKFFSAYATDVESAVGHLTSSDFTISGSGFMTFKLGAGRNTDKVYVDIVKVSTGEILARYGNTLWSERTNDVKSGCTLIPYKADLSDYLGETAYIRITDNAVNDYGLFFADSFVTYYDTEPSNDFNLATKLSAPATIYEILNGGFEDDMTGWTVTGGAIGGISVADTYWAENIPFNKDGDKFFSAYAEGALESAEGVLRSAQFTVGGCGYMTFKFGAAKNSSLVYIDVVDVATGDVLVSYGNSLWTEDGLAGCTLNAYKADLSSILGKTVYVRITDNAINEYGLFFTDSFKTNYNDLSDLPDYALAIPL